MKVSKLFLCFAAMSTLLFACKPEKKPSTQKPDPNPDPKPEVIEGLDVINSMDVYTYEEDGNVLAYFDLYQYDYDTDEGGVLDIMTGAVIKTKESISGEYDLLASADCGFTDNEKNFVLFDEGGSIKIVCREAPTGSTYALYDVELSIKCVDGKLIEQSFKNLEVRGIDLDKSGSEPGQYYEYDFKDEVVKSKAVSKSSLKVNKPYRLLLK